MGDAFELAPQDVVDNCNQVAQDIYEQYFAARLTVGEFLCVLVYLLYRAGQELTRTKDKVQ